MSTQNTLTNGRYRIPRGVAALFLLVFLTSCTQRNDSPPPPNPEVATITIHPGTVALTTELPGRTSSYLVAEIRPQVSGLLQKRLFTEGSDVEAGQLLYQIEPAEFRAALDSAGANLIAARKSADRARASLEASAADVAMEEARLALARINRQRYEDLFQAKAVPESDRDQAATDFDVAEASLKAAKARVENDQQAVGVAEAAIQQAEAAVETARINLAYTTVAAPISGRIGRSSVTDGAIVTAYQPVALATIQQLDPIYVDVPQSTRNLLRLRRHLEEGRLERGENGDDQVELVLEDGSIYPLKGTFEFQDVTVDSSTGSVILRMVFPNPDGLLLPGMFVRTVVKEGVNDNAILVPQQGVSRDRKGNPIVLLVDKQGTVVQRILTIDRAVGEHWLVTSGLAEGDRVIVEGSQKVRPGASVSVISLDRLDKGAAAVGAPAPRDH